MKQRLLVMNGQKLLQSEQGGEWVAYPGAIPFRDAARSQRLQKVCGNF